MVWKFIPDTRVFSLMYISDAATCWVLYIKHIWRFKFTFRNSLLCFLFLVVFLFFFSFKTMSLLFVRLVLLRNAGLFFHLLLFI